MTVARPLAALCVIGVAIMATGAGPSAAAANAGRRAPTWTAAEAPVPANAASDPNVDLYAGSCPTKGTCVVVGDYEDGDIHGHGLIDTFSAGVWAAIEAPLPASATDATTVALQAVSCSGPTSCVAVGSYWGPSEGGQDSSRPFRGAAGRPPKRRCRRTLSTNPDSADLVLRIVTCPAAESCVAIGDYPGDDGFGDEVIETLSGGTWTATEEPVPTGDPTDPGGYLGSVSCPAAGVCEAVGNHLETLSGGTWAPSDITLPANASTTAFGTQLRTVTCPAVGSCVASGGYTDTSDESRGFIDTLSGGGWTAAEAPVPTGTDVGMGDLLSIACPTRGSCVGVSDYEDGAQTQGLIETLSGGDWSAAEALLPTGAAGSQGTVLQSVSCPASGSCAAVGTDGETSGGEHGLIEMLSGGSWAPTQAPLPVNADATGGSLRAVSCAVSDFCVAVGGFFDAGGNQQGLIDMFSKSKASPIITTPDSTVFKLGQSGGFSLTATGSPLPTITETGKLPRGLRFHRGRGTATISGTPMAPDATGPYPVTINAVNGVLPKASQPFTVTISS